MTKDADILDLLPESMKGCLDDLRRLHSLERRAGIDQVVTIKAMILDKIAGYADESKETAHLAQLALNAYIGLPGPQLSWLIYAIQELILSTKNGPDRDVEEPRPDKKMITSTRIEDIIETANTGYEYDSFARGRCVYLIESSDGRVKVGYSRTPRFRVTTVTQAAGVTTKAVHVTPAILNATEIEAAFKSFFASRVINGEWFTVAPSTALEFIHDSDWVFDDSIAAAIDRDKDIERTAAQDRFLRKMFRLDPVD